MTLLLLVSTMEFVVAQNNEILQRIDSVELLSEEEAELYESSLSSSSTTTTAGSTRNLHEATAAMETQKQRGMNTQSSRIRYAQPRNSRDPNIDRSYLVRIHSFGNLHRTVWLNYGFLSCSFFI